MIESCSDISYMDMVSFNGDTLHYPVNPLSRYLLLALGANPIPHPTVAIRRTVFKRIGNYNESLNRCEDFDLWIRALLCGLTIDHIPVVGTIYNINSAQLKSQENSLFQISQIILF